MLITVVGGKTVCVEGEGVYGNSLYFPFNFAKNLELLLKKKRPLNMKKKIKSQNKNGEISGALEKLVSIVMSYLLYPVTKHTPSCYPLQYCQKKRSTKCV